MARNPELDVIVTGGIQLLGGAQVAQVPGHAGFFGSLMELNWLALCGACYRTESVGVESLDIEIFSNEWTHIACRLITEKEV